MNKYKIILLSLISILLISCSDSSAENTFEQIFSDGNIQNEEDLKLLGIKKGKKVRSVLFAYSIFRDRLAARAHSSALCRTKQRWRRAPSRRRSSVAFARSRRRVPSIARRRSRRRRRRSRDRNIVGSAKSFLAVVAAMPAGWHPHARRARARA